jgi:hypothetical protein
MLHHRTLSFNPIFLSVPLIPHPNQHVLHLSPQLHRLDRRSSHALRSLLFPSTETRLIVVATPLY